jgi:DNA-3-methyladenine glycosylase II
MREALRHLRRRDPVLGAIIERVGEYKIEYRDPSFDTVVRSIVYQQVSGKAAATIYGRLAAAVTGVSPDQVLRLRPSRMKALGLSRQKTEYIRDLARRTRNGDLDFPVLPSLDDNSVIERLTEVKGVGVWTAQMFLIFALRRPDVLPTGDLGVRAAIRKAYSLQELPAPKLTEEIAQPWRPYCSVASWYLWRSLDGMAAL